MNPEASACAELWHHVCRVITDKSLPCTVSSWKQCCQVITDIMWYWYISHTIWYGHHSDIIPYTTRQYRVHSTLKSQLLSYRTGITQCRHISYHITTILDHTDIISYPIDIISILNLCHTDITSHIHQSTHSLCHFHLAIYTFTMLLLKSLLHGARCLFQ